MGSPVITNAASVPARIQSNVELLGGTLPNSLVRVTVAAGTAGTDDLIISGVISGIGGITKFGPGRMLLTQSNTYNGETTINDGYLRITNAQALGSANGSPSTGTTVSGGTLELDGGISVGNEALTLNGSGPTGQGALVNTAGDNAISGPITLGSTSTINVGSGTTLTALGAISGSGQGTLTKSGGGTLVLKGASTFTGTTSLNLGTLLVDGSLPSAISLNGGTLGGTGTVGPVTATPAGGTVAPGDSPGTLTTGSIAWNAATNYNIEIASASSYDQLNVDGSVNLGNANLNLLVNPGFATAPAETITIIQNDGNDPVVGTFNNLPQYAIVMIDDIPYYIRYDGGDGNDVVLVNTSTVVTNTNDTGLGSLRRAIQVINDLPAIPESPRPITFQIPGPGVQAIRPLTLLPPITKPVMIDGYTQPGAKPNTLADGDNAVLPIELSGDRAPEGTSGLAITGGGSTVEGLVINQFKETTDSNSPTGFSGGFGIDLEMNGGNTIQGNFIGTDTRGTAGLGNQGGGVRIFGGSGKNTIGGTTPASRNIISGNSRHGLGIGGIVSLTAGGVLNSAGNLIQGNFIGTDVTGTKALGNSQDGVIITSSSNNTVGGTASGARNVISGNGLNGIDLADSGTTGTIVQSNFIGTDVTGTTALGNGSHGILISSTEGTTNPSSFGNQVLGNSIKSNGDGVLLDASSDNMIGGTGLGNIIADNLGVGIQAFNNSNENLIQENTVTGNGTDGVYINTSSDNTILGNVIERNHSASDRGVGVQIFSGTRNRVLSNQIQSNGTDGVFINSSSGNVIGQAGQGNVISRNLRVGVQIFGGKTMVGASNNVVQGNTITDNGLDGVALNSASGNTIGGNASPAGTMAGNVITGNRRSGVNILGSRAMGNSTDNSVLGNVIRGNNGFDIALQPPVIGNVIGGPLGEANDLSTPVAVYAGGRSRNRIGRNMHGPSGARSVGPRSTPGTGHGQRHKVR